jgi:hypothetical protein
MFEKLKQIKDLRTQAKTMQNALSGEAVTVEKNGISLTINGNLELTNLTSVLHVWSATDFFAIPITIFGAHCIDLYAIAVLVAKSTGIAFIIDSKSSLEALKQCVDFVGSL